MQCKLLTGNKTPKKYSKVHMSVPSTRVTKRGHKAWSHLSVIPASQSEAAEDRRFEYSLIYVINSRKT